MDRALGTLRTLYAISFVLGFQKLGEAVYFLIFQDHTHLFFSRAVNGLLCLLTLSLALFGFRFFWTVGVIRRFVLYRIYMLRPPHRSTLMLYMAVLFAFPVLFFFLCRLFQDFCSSLSLAPFAPRFVFVFSVLLLLNTPWLWLLTPKTRRQKPGIATDHWSLQSAERCRLANNLVWGILALLWLCAATYFHLSTWL